MKDFDGCPRRYYQVKILNAYPFQETTATMYGKEVHSACEHYIKSGTSLGGHGRFKPVLDKLISYKGDKYTELEMGMGIDASVHEFTDEFDGFRGIADLIIVDGDKARVVDYKTGKANYPDPKQLELMALMVFVKFPDVMHVKAALLFLLHDVMVKREYDRKDFNYLLQYWLNKRDNILSCAKEGVWNPSPSGLCSWCPHEVCEHWKPKRR
jgi:predicted RecB family nuclease